MADERPGGRPLAREQFNRLCVGDQLRDRQGRSWTVTAEPREEHGLRHLMIRSGDLVRRVNERFADDYMLAE